MAGPRPGHLAVRRQITGSGPGDDDEGLVMKFGGPVMKFRGPVITLKKWRRTGNRKSKEPAVREPQAFPAR